MAGGFVGYISGYRGGRVGVAMRCAYFALLSGSSIRHFPLVPSSQIRAQESPGTQARQGGDYRPRAHGCKRNFE